MAATISTEPQGASIQELHLTGVSLGYQGSKAWVIFHCFPRSISRELERKWYNHDSNRCLYGRMVLHTVTSFVIPQLWCLFCHLKWKSAGFIKGLTRSFFLLISFCLSSPLPPSCGVSVALSPGILSQVFKSFFPFGDGLLY